MKASYEVKKSYVNNNYICFSELMENRILEQQELKEQGIVFIQQKNKQ